MSASSNSNALLYPRQLGSGQRQIRVLSFETDSDQDDAIHLGMLEIPLDEDLVSYDALSYTWGNPTPEAARENPWITEHVPPFDYAPRWIYVNEQALKVTANLFFALQRLRLRFQHRYPGRCLWVDAICINQDDLDERAEQVKLMGDVYRNATDVLVWLGEEEGETDSEMAIALLQNVYDSFISWGDNDEEAMSLIERMDQEGEYLQVDHRMTTTGVPVNEIGNILANLVRLQTLWIERVDFSSSLDVRCDARAWAAVARLLERSWFTRLWTYQEKALAKSATLVVGGKSMSWTNIVTVMGLITNHDNTRGRVKVLPKGQGRRLFESSQPSEAQILAMGGAHQNLFEVVRTASSRGCSNPRDKIYGVLNTMSKQDAGYMHIFGIVDYTTSVQDLYTEFARFYLEDQQDLRILQSCSPYPRQLDGLPSWAPDWSKPQFGNMLPAQAYRAANQSDPLIEYRSDSQEMLLFGVAIDRVGILAPLTHSDMSDITAMGQSEQAVLATTHFGHFVSLYMAARGVEFQQKLEGKWIDLAGSIKWEEPYPTGGSYPEAYWRTLIGDMDPYAVAHVFNRRTSPDLSVCNLVDIWSERKPVPVDFEPNEPDMNLRRGKLLFPVSARAQAMTLGKHFYLTEKGFMGFGTHNAQEEDVVVVFLGCTVPMLLRKHDGHYTVVGETYGMFISRETRIRKTYLSCLTVHGLMDGKAMDMLDEGEDLTEFNLR